MRGGTEKSLDHICGSISNFESLLSASVNSCFSFSSTFKWSSRTASENGGLLPFLHNPEERSHPKPSLAWTLFNMVILTH